MALKKSEKKMLIALGAVALLGGVMLYRIYGPQSPSTEEIIEPAIEEVATKSVPTQQKTSSGGTNTGGGKSSSKSSSSTPESKPIISMQSFTENNEPKSCWVLIDGEVYNISPYMEEYSSDIDEIAQFCGTLGFEVGYLKEKPSLIGLIKDRSINLGQIG